MKSNRKVYYGPYFRLSKRLNVQSLYKKSGKHLQKIYGLKGLKNRNLVAYLKANCLRNTSMKGKNSVLQKYKVS